MSLPVRAPSLARLVAGGVVDAELAALAWLLLEDGIPVLVVGMEEVTRDELLDALAAALPASRRPNPAAPVGEGRLVRVPGTLATSTPPGSLRAALARTTARSGLAATIEGTDLAEALAVLRRQGLSEDEASFLGTVLVLGPVADRPVADRPVADRPVADRPAAEPGAAMPGRDQRVVASHYLRPVARDAGGHVQRLGPAVLATWDAEHGAYDHFEWGIYPELAARTGRRAGDLEAAHRGRAEELRSGAH